MTDNQSDTPNYDAEEANRLLHLAHTSLKGLADLYAVQESALSAERAKNAASEEKLTEWLCREMPPGTVIGDPKWWAPKILRAMKGTP